MKPIEQGQPLTCTILPVKTWAEREGGFSATMCVYRQHEGDAPFLLAKIYYDQAHIDNAGQHRIAKKIMGQDPEIAKLRKAASLMLDILKKFESQAALSKDMIRGAIVAAESAGVRATP